MMCSIILASVNFLLIFCWHFLCLIVFMRFNSGRSLLNLVLHCFIFFVYICLVSPPDLDIHSVFFSIFYSLKLELLLTLMVSLYALSHVSLSDFLWSSVPQPSFPSFIHSKVGSLKLNTKCAKPLVMVNLCQECNKTYYLFSNLYNNYNILISTT